VRPVPLLREIHGVPSRPAHGTRAGGFVLTRQEAAGKWGEGDVVLAWLRLDQPREADRLECTERNDIKENIVTASMMGNIHENNAKLSLVWTW
jgi:hypothetical protein